MNIEIKRFKKRYKNQLIELNEIKLTKRVVILKGKNGSGKSTLLKALGKVIYYEGMIKNNMTFSFIPDKIYYPKGITLKEYLNVFNRLDKYNKEKYQKLLIMFKLDKQLEKDVTELSKGMKSKVNVLLGLCLERELYIMDEPFDGMDKHSKTKLQEYINESKESFIISTHIKEEVIIADFQEVVL